MHKTTTVPETVTLPGEFLLEMIARLDWWQEWAWDQLAGGTTSGPGDDVGEVAWGLFFRAFRGFDFGDDSMPDGYDCERDELYQEVEARSRALGREWAGRIAKRHGVGALAPEGASDA
jgi:hypothetical protein